MKREYDSTGVNMENNFTAAPEGVYNLVVVKANDMKNGMPWKTQKGDDYVSVECEIDDAGEWLGKKLWHGVTFIDPVDANGKPRVDAEGKPRKGAGMALIFLKAIGEPYQGKFEIDTDNWAGKRFRAKLRVSKDMKGNPRNEIAYIITEDQKEEEAPF